VRLAVSIFFIQETKLISQMFDLFKLHTHKQNHIENEKRELFESKIGKINLKINERRKQLSKFGDSKTNVAQRKNLEFEISELKKELPILEKKMAANHISDYLLEAMPMVQRYSRLEHSVKREDIYERDSILDMYIRKFYEQDYKRFKRNINLGDSKFMDVVDQTKRESPCCKAYLVQMSNSSIVCTECGAVVEESANIGQNAMANLSYARNITPIKVYSYRRLNHLRELIRQLTGKTQNTLNKEQIDMIKEEIRKNYIDPDDVTPQYIRSVLKKLTLNRYYDQCTSITMNINKTYTPPAITDDYEEKLVVQFCMLESPFAEIRKQVDKTRKNFLSYRYTFYRLNQLNSRMDLNAGIHLLKSVKLLNKQDKFWKLLMQKLNWPYLGALSTHESIRLSQS